MTTASANVERPGERVCEPWHRRHARSARKHKWKYAFWDAPLSIPGYYPAAGAGRGAVADGAAVREPKPRNRRWVRAARSPTRLRRCSRARAAGRASIRIPTRLASPEAAVFRCHGSPRRFAARVSVLGLLVRGQERRRQPGSHVPEDEARHFDGNLRFTVYRGTNLLQMDAIARTNSRLSRIRTTRAEGIFDGDDAACDVARYRRPSTTTSVRRAEGDRSFRRPCVNSLLLAEAARLDRVPSAAHVLLHA